MAVKATATVTVFNVADGTDGRMLYATCQTAPLTAAKVATVSSGRVSLYTGLTVAVQFMHTNTAASPTLNVNGTGAKAIFVNGAAITAADYWVAGATHTFVYDGSRWIMSDVQSVDVGGRNLVPFAWMSKKPTDMRAGTSTQDMTVSWWVNTLMTHDQLVAQFEPSGTYTCHYDAEFVEPCSGYDVVYDGKVGLLFYSPSTPSAYRVLTMLLVTQNDYSAGRTASFTTTFTLPDEFPSDYCLVGYTPYFRNSSGAPGVRSWATIRNLKIEKGTTATDWSPAPEDVQSGIDSAQTTANAVTGTVDAMNSGSRNLVLNSAKPVTSSNYNVANYTLAEDLVVGEPYSVTVWGEASQQFGVWLSNGSTAWVNPAFQSGKPVLGDGFVRWEGIKCPSPANGNLRRINIFNSPDTPGQTATIERIKLERGSVGTAWSAAPEDVEEAKDLANQGIKEQVTLFYAAASASTPAKPTANVTTSSATTYAAWNRTLPTYRAANPYLYVCTQSLTNGGAYSWSAVEPGNYADWAAALGTRLTIAETQISQNTDAITLRATKTEVQQSIDNISVGGTNIYLGDIADRNINSNNSSVWPISTSKMVDESMGMAYLHIVRSGAGTNNTNFSVYNSPRFSVLSEPLAPGQTYTASCLVRTNCTCNNNNSTYWTSSTLFDPALQLLDKVYGPAIEGTGEWERWWMTFTVPEYTSQTGFRILPSNLNFGPGVTWETAYVDFARYKIERGNKATAWSPAPEDVRSGIDSAQNAADKAQQDVNSLGVRVTQAETSITQNADAIALRATKTEVQQSIDNISVGGTNLVLDSEGPASFTKPSDNAHVAWWRYLSDQGQALLANGGTVTVSFDARVSSGSSVRVSPYITMYNGSTNTTMSPSGQTTMAVTGDWQRFSRTLPVSGAANRFQITVSSGAGTSGTVIEVRRVKCETGSKATDWSPAPKDMATAAELEITADSITQRVDGLDGDIASVTTTANSFSIQLESAIAGVRGEINNNTDRIDTVTAMVNVTSDGGRPVLGLGSKGSPLAVQLTNEQLDFIDSGHAVTSINGQKLHITMAEVTGHLRVGNFAFIPRENGNLSLKKVV